MGRATAGGLSWPVALRLGRVSNLPTVWSNVLTGVVLSGRAAPPRVIVALMLALSLLYTAGMFLNDAFDREIDRRERPDRPIPSGEVAAASVFAAGYGMMAAGWGVLLWIGYAGGTGTGWRAPAAGAVLAAVVVIYDVWHKGNPLGPVIMGSCRALVYLVAGLAIVPVPPAGLLVAAFLLLTYLIGLSHAAKQETRRRMDRVWPVMLVAAPLLYSVPAAGSSSAGLIVYAAFLAWVAYSLSFLLVPRRVNVARGVVGLIAGISLLDAVFIAGGGRFDLALLAMGAFALTFVLQRYIAGT